MEMGELNLRVGMQSSIGTTLVWNKTALTEDQRNNVVVFVRILSMGSPPSDWHRPKAVKPPITGQLAHIVDENSDCVMLPHVVTGMVSEKVTFEVRLVFGSDQSREAGLRVEPKGQGHMPFVKPRRIEMGGKTTYAQPVYIEGVAPEVIQQIVDGVTKGLPPKEG